MLFAITWTEMLPSFWWEANYRLARETIQRLVHLTETVQKIDGDAHILAFPSSNVVDNYALACAYIIEQMNDGKCIVEYSGTDSTTVTVQDRQVQFLLPKFSVLSIETGEESTCYMVFHFRSGMPLGLLPVDQAGELI